MRKAYSIYKQLLGEEHERTNESSECLKHLTQQAVKFQKTMNQLSKGEKVNSISPLQIQTPSMANVLETLNLINGIVFVHISSEDIERFREEMVRHQMGGGGGATAGRKSLGGVETRSKSNGEDDKASDDTSPNASPTTTDQKPLLSGPDADLPKTENNKTVASPSACDEKDCDESNHTEQVVQVDDSEASR